MKAKMALELWLEQPEEWISGMGSALGLAGLELMNQVSSLGMLCPRCLLDDGHSKVSHFTSLVAMAVGRNALSSVLCPMPSGQGTDPHLSAPFHKQKVCRIRMADLGFTADKSKAFHSSPGDFNISSI